MKLWPWKGRVAVKKRGFKEKKRTAKEEKAFQEQLAIDRRNSAIRFRTDYIRNAIFLINQAEHRLQHTIEYFDCSQNPDFDDLNHNVYHALSFIEFAQEKLSEISDRDYELGIHPEQVREKLNEEAKHGRRKRNVSGKGKKRSQSGQGEKRKN
jgi:hypothetical protein